MVVMPTHELAYLDQVSGDYGMLPPMARFTPDPGFYASPGDAN